MDIFVKTTGDSVYRVLTNLASLSELPDQFGGERVQWNIQKLGSDPLPRVLFDSHVQAVLFDIANKAAANQTVQLLQHLRLPSLKKISPVIIMACASEDCLDGISEMPDVFSDWVIAPICPQDIARRIFRDLKVKGLIQQSWQNGSLRLLDHPRILAFENREACLTSTEFMLVQYFFDRLECIVSFPELVDLFKTAGKSVQPNNIRVAMFQLRLKLDAVTEGQFNLDNIYKQGYCIRRKAKSQIEVTDLRVAATPSVFINNCAV